VLHGRSMGGAVAAYLGQKVQAGAIIIESAYTELPQYLAERFRILPFQWLTQERFTTRNYLRRAKSPVLIIHSTQDRVIPYQHGIQLYEVVKQPKSMLTLQGSHDACFLTNGAQYTDQIKRFLSNHMQHKSEN
jgi:uncharacterized protein